MIGIEIGQDVCTIRFKRPQKKNALTCDMYAEATEALRKAAESNTVKALVIRGEGDYFCSGHDINDFLRSGGIHSDHPLLGFLSAIESFPKMLVGVVEGSAIGIGVTMLFHCDFVISMRKAKFQTPFITLGLCAEAGSSRLAERILGKPLAREMLLLGAEIPAAKLDGKLINDITDTPSQTEAALKILLSKIKRLPMSGILQNKDLMRERGETIVQTMEREAKSFALLLKSPATQKIIAAKLAESATKKQSSVKR